MPNNEQIAGECPKLAAPSVSWEYVGEELALFWVSPYGHGKEKIATFWWPIHPPENTGEVERSFEVIASRVAASPCQECAGLREQIEEAENAIRHCSALKDWGPGHIGVHGSRVTFLCNQHSATVYTLCLLADQRDQLRAELAAMTTKYEQMEGLVREAQDKLVRPGLMIAAETRQQIAEMRDGLAEVRSWFRPSAPRMDNATTWHIDHGNQQRVVRMMDAILQKYPEVK